MNKTMDFAQEISAQIEGSEVQEVEKANGVKLTGIVFPTGAANVKAIIYADDLMKEGLTVEEAAEKIRKVQELEATNKINIDFINDFEAVKPRLRARLFNERTSAAVKKSAAEYGFSDLVIIPYITGIETGNGAGAIKVTAGLMETWGVSPDEVIRIAEDNSKDDFRITSMASYLAGMGQPMPGIIDDPMSIVTNESMSFGAYAIIPALDDLKKRFKNGFIVLPSSVHEVLVVDVTDSPELDLMVEEVNDTTVNPTEQLSNHAYRIAA